MKQYKRLLLPLVLSFVILFGCQTNPPTYLNNNISGYGKLYIYSLNVDSAQIYVDNVFTGKYAPDTLTISEGSHLIELKKIGYNTFSYTVNIKKNELQNLTYELTVQSERMVVIEEFSNVSCVPCVATNKILESLSSQFASRLAVIKYSSNFPSPNDPFYLANKSNNDWMMSYYKIISTPTVILNGTEKPTSSDSVKIKNAINQQLLKPSQFIMNLQDSIGMNDYFITVSINNIDTSGIDFSNLVLKVIIIEKEIEFATPPGQSGETKFFNVCRAMLPTNTGADISNIKGTNKVYQFSIPINSGWNRNMIGTVCFVQDKNLKIIYQSTSKK